MFNAMCVEWILYRIKMRSYLSDYRKSLFSHLVRRLFDLSLTLALLYSYSSEKKKKAATLKAWRLSSEALGRKDASLSQASIRAYLKTASSPSPHKKRRGGRHRMTMTIIMAVADQPRRNGLSQKKKNANNCCGTRGAKP
jgi:hypothetical protein